MSPEIRTLAEKVAQESRARRHLEEAEDRKHDPEWYDPNPFGQSAEELQHTQLPQTGDGDGGHGKPLDEPASQSSPAEVPVVSEPSADAEGQTGGLLDLLLDSRDHPRADSPPAGRDPDAPVEKIFAHDLFGAPNHPCPAPAPLLPALPDERPNIPRQKSPIEWPSRPEPRFPSNFPAYHSTQNMNEIAAYLANASYVAALGGPPLADLKYGIIIVPAGEESLLFGRSPDFEISKEFRDAVHDCNRDLYKAMRMHNPDEDSPEFVRHRFDDNFPPVSAEAHQADKLSPIDEEREEEESDSEDETSDTGDAEEPPQNKPRRSITLKPSGIVPDGSPEEIQKRAGQNTKRVTAPAAKSSKPQGIAKTRGNPRTARGRGNKAKGAAARGKK